MTLGISAESARHSKVSASFENSFRATSLATLAQMVSSGAGITQQAGVIDMACAHCARLHARAVLDVDARDRPVCRHRRAAHCGLDPAIAPLDAAATCRGAR